MKAIKLTNGGEVIVDDSDYPLLSQFPWYGFKTGRLGNRVPIVKLKVGRKWLNVTMHRLLLLPSTELCVHHVNGNSLDNRRENLRVCTKTENNRAFRRKTPGATSCYRGVCWDQRRKKWKAYIETGGKLRNLGRFDTELDAARTYNEVAKILFGDFAHLNTVE